MLIRIYNEDQYEVLARLKEADDYSHSRKGSHDDTRLQIAINGEPRAIRQHTYDDISVRRSYGNDWTEDPGEFPHLADIKTAVLLETYAHRGAGMKSRSKLCLYRRLGRVGDKFVVFDLGEDGNVDESKAPFNELTVLGALLKAKKPIHFGFEYVQVPISDFVDNNGRPMRDANEWIESAFKAAYKLVTDIKATCETNCYSSTNPRGALEALWINTALGRYLHQLGLS